jgi:hypothetical protein
MTMEVVLPYQAVRHKRTGGIYRVLQIVLMKQDGDWKDAVHYRSIYDISKPDFVRELEAFKQNFEAVDLRTLNLATLPDSEGGQRD